MKTYKNLYSSVVAISNRREAVANAMHSKRVRETMKRRHLSYDVVVNLSYDWITDYKIVDHTPIYIYDGISRKQRTIVVPTLEELIVQHCVVNAMKPMFYKGMYEHSYASIPSRGVHKAKKHIESFIKNNPTKCKYVLKMDIRHFFDTIPHDILFSKLSTYVKDDELLRLLHLIIDNQDHIGLPLGFYTSQWISNWYLQVLDHYIKEELHARIYIRYMDDMVIFDSNKKNLHFMQTAIDDFLHDRLGLEMKNNWQVFLFDKGNDTGRDLDFMGFRFYRNKTTLRKSIMYKATRTARRCASKIKPTVYDARQMLSYYGWLSDTDTYKAYTDRIKPYVSKRKLRKIVSAKDKKLDNRVYAKIVKLYL